MCSDHAKNHISKGNIEEELQSTTSSYQAQTEQHKFISIKRAASKENLLLQATKKLRTSKRKFPPAQIGNTARKQVPDVDRGSRADMCPPAAVVGIEDFNFYKLLNGNGGQAALYP